MARTRKIVVAITGAAGLSGGIARANLNGLRSIGRLADERGLDLEVLSLHEGAEHRPAFLGAGVAFRGFRASVASFSRALAWAARPGVLAYVDHVGLAGPLLPAALTGLARTVIFAHGWEAWGSQLRARYALSFRCATLVLTNSSVTLRKMRSRLRSFRGETCLLGIAPEFPLHDTPPSAVGTAVVVETADGTRRAIDAPFFLMVARMSAEERQKGHLPMLDAWPAVVRRHPGASLVFAGGGDDLHNVRAAARERGLENSVIFTGRVDDATLKRLYAACHAFVMPSTQEGFGLVYLEAMNYAKACLGCWDQGTEDVIVDGSTGLLVRDPANRDELEQALIRLFSDAAETREMGLRGFQRLHAHFTAEQAQRRVRERLEPLL